jgi:hypothetical protein
VGEPGAKAPPFPPAPSHLAGAESVEKLAGRAAKVGGFAMQETVKKEYIEREAARDLMERALEDDWEIQYANDRLRDIPAADVVEVRQIRAFIDKLIAERDKYDLHSMRWEHYDCDRLLIEQMLDEIAGGERKGVDE